jgi:hypothetical protein
LDVDSGPLVTVTVRDEAGVCPSESVWVNPTESATLKLPWCAGRYVVEPGSSCLKGSAAIVIPLASPDAVGGEHVFLKTHPLPCGAPNALHIDRDGDEYLAAWDLSDAPRDGVRVWWQLPGSAETVMVEAVIRRFGRSSLQRRLATRDRGTIAVTPLFSEDDFSVVPSPREKLRVRQLRDALDIMTSPVEHRCYASCDEATEMTPAAFQVFADREMRWMVRRVPVELLQEASTSQGLATLLRYVAAQDATWDALAPRSEH